MSAEAPRPGLGPPKMPVRQLVILSIARFSEPVALTSILPYLPEMIESFGVPRNDVGRWSGVCMSVFSISQSICGIPWGALSDTLGRKPTIIFGLFSTMVVFVLWGLCKDLRAAVAVRILGGVSNGNVGIIRTMVAEMVPWKALQPAAFSIMPMVWGIGSVLGPIMGGFFANPARRWPGMFATPDGDGFWERYPYALPSFVAATIFLGSLMSAIFFLEETLEKRRHKRDWGTEIGHRFMGLFGTKLSTSTPALLLPPKPNASEVPKKKHTVRDVLSRHTVCFLLAYFALGMHAIAFEQVLSVFLSHPWRDHTADNTAPPFFFGGGFGLSSEQIGTLFMLYGMVGLTQFLVFPPLARRLGVLRCFRLFSLIHPFYMLLLPYVVLLPTADQRWYAILFVMCLKAAASVVAFPALTILITNSASSLAVLGTINGAAVTVAGLGRALGPATAGAIFSWGVRRNLVIAPWWYLACVSVLGALPAFLVDEPDNLPRGHEEESDESQQTTCCASAANSDDECGEESGLLERPARGYGTS